MDAEREKSWNHKWRFPIVTVLCGAVGRGNTQSRSLCGAEEQLFQGFVCLSHALRDSRIGLFSSLLAFCEQLIITFLKLQPNDKSETNHARTGQNLEKVQKQVNLKYQISIGMSLELPQNIFSLFFALRSLLTDLAHTLALR